MLSLKIGAEDHRPLVEQIVVGICREIDERHLRSGHPHSLDPQLRRAVSRQPLYRGRGIRPTGGDGLSALAPRRGVLCPDAPADRRGLARKYVGPADNEQLVWLTRRCCRPIRTRSSPVADGCRMIGTIMAGMRQSLNVSGSQERCASDRLRQTVRLSAVARAPVRAARRYRDHRTGLAGPADDGGKPGARFA